MVYVLDEAQVKKTREELAELERNFLNRIQNPSSKENNMNSELPFIDDHPSKNRKSSPTRGVESWVPYHHNSFNNQRLMYPPPPEGSTSGPLLFSGVNVDLSSDPQFAPYISYNLMNRGDDIDWYRFFEEMKQLQKTTPFMITATHPLPVASTDSDSVAPSTHLCPSPSGHQNPNGSSNLLGKVPYVRLDPVRSFLSSTLEPLSKKRKYLLPDDPLEPQASSNDIDTAENDVDPLDEFVTSYINSKPIRM